MFEAKKTCWLSDFSQTRQDIMEDAFLLDALAWYVANDGHFLHGDSAEYFSPVFIRLCDYLFQHALELHRLEERLGPDPQ